MERERRKQEQESVAEQKRNIVKKSDPNSYKPNTMAEKQVRTFEYKGEDISQIIDLLRTKEKKSEIEEIIFEVKSKNVALWEALKNAGIEIVQNEKTRTALLHLGFKASKKLFLSAIKEEQRNLITSMLKQNLLSLREVSFSEEEVPVVDDKMISLLGEKYNKPFIQKAAKVQEEKRKRLEEEAKVDIQKKPNRSILIYSEAVENDTNESLEISIDLKRNLKKMIENDESYKRKLIRGRDKTFELRGLGNVDKNRRIIYKNVGDKIVILYSYLKTTPKIPKKVMVAVDTRLIALNDKEFFSSLKQYYPNLEDDLTPAAVEMEEEEDKEIEAMVEEE